jgi:hypothetical protein|nr:MAG TPA: hypothetical protein [Herelleviridae sp.]
MMPLNIDISEVVEEFALTATQSMELSDVIIDRIVVEYTFKWENLVDNNLKGLRNVYKNAMYVDKKSPTEVIFGLREGENGLAMALEEGKEAWDEKPFFEASPRKRLKAMGGGWYLTVPFRHATPEAVAESGIFQSVLPKEIYDIAKNNGGRGVSMAQLPEQYRQLGSRKEIVTARGVIPEYTHKAPKYLGLVRVNVSSTDKENRGSYMTFRRVSDRSDPNSWIHPGFDAHKFMDKALDQADIYIVADMAIDNFLAQL